MGVAKTGAMGALASVTALMWGLAATAQTTPPAANPATPPLGPINADLPQGGDAYRRAIVASPVVAPNSSQVSNGTLRAQGVSEKLLFSDSDFD